MSLKLDTLVAIRDSQGLSPQEKLVLWTIYSRGETHTASLLTLAKDMGYTDNRQTQRVVTSLKDKGILRITPRPGQSSLITIDVEVLKTHVLQDTPVVQDRGPTSSKTGDPRPTRRTKENKKEKEKENGAAAVAPASNPDSLSYKDDAVPSPSLISARKEERGEAQGKESNATPVLQDVGGKDDYDALARRDDELWQSYQSHLAIYGRGKYEKAYNKAVEFVQKRRTR